MTKLYKTIRNAIHVSIIGDRPDITEVDPERFKSYRDGYIRFLKLLIAFDMQISIKELSSHLENSRYNRLLLDYDTEYNFKTFYDTQAVKYFGSAAVV